MHRVLWKLKSDARQQDADVIAEDTGAVRGPEPVFSRTTGSGTSDWPMLEPVPPLPPALALHFHAFFNEENDARRALKKLHAAPSVEFVELQRCPEVAIADQHSPPNPGVLKSPKLTPQVATDTPDYSAYQQYLHPAPTGMSVAFAWHTVRSTGRGIRIIDIEHGWNFRHEDLGEHQFGVIHGAPKPHDHGTAVLGIISSDNNHRGVVGLAPHAMIGAASGDDDEDGTWNAENGIYMSLGYLDAGDVLLLEMHVPGPHASPVPTNPTKGYLPVEYFQAAFDAVAYAVRKGIYVVAAAGNGGVSLDEPSLGGRFDRRVRDSGAILVGAGGSGVGPFPRKRLSFSNYGSRIDVQGWGEHVATTGGRSHPRYYDLSGNVPRDRCYTSSFSGTSSAAPLVAGAVALISSAIRQAGLRTLSPPRMRELIRATGTPQAEANGEHIGPLPDLRAALTALGLPLP